eukprot:g23455.t2
MTECASALRAKTSMRRCRVARTPAGLVGSKPFPRKAVDISWALPPQPARALRKLASPRGVEADPVEIQRDERERMASQRALAEEAAAAAAAKTLAQAEEVSRRRDEMVERLAQEIRDLKEKLAKVGQGAQPVDPTAFGAPAVATPNGFGDFAQSWALPKEGGPASRDGGAAFGDSNWGPTMSQPGSRQSSKGTPKECQVDHLEITQDRSSRRLSTASSGGGGWPDGQAASFADGWSKQRTRSSSGELPVNQWGAGAAEMSPAFQKSGSWDRGPALQRSGSGDMRQTPTMQRSGSGEMRQTPSLQRSGSGDMHQTPTLRRSGSGDVRQTAMQRSGSGDSRQTPTMQRSGSGDMRQTPTMQISGPGDRHAEGMNDEAWAIEEDRLEKYRSVFVRADLDEDGFVEPMEARDVLAKANLPEDESMASKGFLACNPFREVCCSNSTAEHSDVYDGAQSQTLIYGEEDVAPAPQVAAKVEGGTKFADLVEKPEMEVEGGARYKGQWRGNMRHGHGILTRADGHRYEGAWLDNRAHGHGTFTESSGTSYEGPTLKEWYVHIDGTTYEGEWHSDEKSGRGIETWSDGARYEGEFLHGSKHGVGIYKSGTGVQYEGQFHNDQILGKTDQPWNAKALVPWNQGLMPSELPAPLLALAQRSTDWSVKAEELGHYLQSFQRLDAQSKGIVGQEEGREIFEQSGLPVQELSFIWQLCDRDGDGNLVFPEFAMAMAMVARRRRGWSLPSTLPLALVRSVDSFGPVNWTVAPGELDGYRTIWRSLERSGFADPAAAKERQKPDLLEQSQLPVSDLSTIYAMSDFDHDGRLSEPEFLCAMALVARRRQGAALPESVPPELREACWSQHEEVQPQATATWQPNTEELTRFQQLFTQLQDYGYVSAERAREATPELQMEHTARVCHMGNRDKPEEEPPWVRFLTEKAAQDALDAIEKGRIPWRCILRSSFTKLLSGLPLDDLAKIWDLADAGDDGKLDLGEFFCAMSLSARRREGHELPDAIPNELLPFLRLRDTEQEMQRYLAIFQKSVPRGATMPSDRAREILEMSELPPSELAQIWRLCGAGDGLDQNQFLCAMALTARRRQGQPLPPVMPPDLFLAAQLV